MLARIIPTPSYISESVRGAMTRPSLSLLPTFLCRCFLVSRGVVIVGKLAKSGPRTRFHGSVGIGGWRIQRKRLTINSLQEVSTMAAPWVAGAQARIIGELH